MRKYGLDNFIITVYVLPTNKYNHLNIELARTLKIRDVLSLEQYFIITLNPTLNTIKVAGSSFVSIKEKRTNEPFDLLLVTFTWTVFLYFLLYLLMLCLFKLVLVRILFLLINEKERKYTDYLTFQVILPLQT